MPFVEGPLSGTLRAHRSMACVTLAALEPCAAGFPAAQAAAAAAVRSGFGGGTGGGVYGVSVSRQGWLEQACVLECVAETTVADVAAIIRSDAAARGAALCST